mgnify:FL=1
MRHGHIAGVAITLINDMDYETFYLPIGHEAGGNLSKSWVLNYVKALCADERIEKVFHNAMYDIGWLTTEGIEVKGEIYDTMYAAALIDENRYSYSLDNLGSDWCGMGKDETLLKEAAASYGIAKNAVKANMWRLHPRFVGPYAEQDTLATTSLWQYTRQHIISEGLQEIFNIEIALIPLLIKMRQQGIRVDMDKAAQVRKELVKKQKEIHGEIYRKYNHKVNVWASSSLVAVFDEAGLAYPRTPKGAPSFTKEFLAAQTHDLPLMILRARKIEKTINTFVDGMIKDQSFDGRIHCELHPLKSDDGGTVTGRMSCSNPNLQQTSARDPEFGPLVRGLFLPEPGCEWWSLDYASQEPRLTVHYASLTHQNGAKEAVLGYNEDPRMDYHRMIADICGIERKPAKTINLGLAYGMGAVKLCESLGLPTETVTGYNGKDREVAGEEGITLMELYHEKVPFVQGLTDQCANLAGDRGFIKTLLGRKCHFDTWEPVGGYGSMIKGREAAEERWPDKRLRRAMTHKAMNRLIQGSAADMTKKAMVEIHKEGIVPMLQMHDELDFSLDNEKDAARCAEIMENCVQLEVPSVVDIEHGDSWGTAK